MPESNHPTRQKLRAEPIDPKAVNRKWLKRVGAEKEYKEKLAAIKNGTTGDDFVLFGGEMVRYLIEKQNISEKDLNAALGFGRNYFRSNIFNYAWNNGDAAFPEPFRKRMAELTRESLEKAGKDPVEFWCKRNFTLADVDGLFIDMTRDISEAKVQYPKTEPPPETKAALEKIPKLARTILIDPNTAQWRRNTFLIDADGNFAAEKSMPSLRYMVEQPNHTPEQVITALTNRKTDDPYFYDKGQFMRQVMITAKEQRLIGAAGRVQSYIPLRAENACEWSR